MSTATTRIFKSGNSLAVRIPKDMLPAEIPQEAQIDWENGVWTIRPLHRRSLAGLMDVFRAFPADFMAGGREFHEQKERDWSGVFEPDPPAPKGRLRRAKGPVKA
jgi:antitoxin VapB